MAEIVGTLFGKHVSDMIQNCGRLKKDWYSKRHVIPGY